MPISFANIAVGNRYGRSDLASLWNYAGIEAIMRGVVTPRDDNKIVLFVTLNKHPDATQYDDELVGPVLLWEGPNDHFAEDRIVDHVGGGDEIHLFYRDQPRDDFTYAGPAIVYCCQRFTDRPSRFAFRLLNNP